MQFEAPWMQPNDSSTSFAATSILTVITLAQLER
jgi:hypothetical protein